ncbi:hypothetical protein HP550_14650 [Cellulomonas humilata]|uniref:LSDAT prokaryote domain-containing protein n=1 Tax=Cellulomonas humilata TaxID=144055 RepID=A0A7Y6A2C5_9CELL|nr:hypothetical protein [Cellulomonas humilata]NUU18493.1 hypothetical protein [Cellulomonas humilata]
MTVTPAGTPPVAEVTAPDQLPDALAALGIPARRPVLVCVGGADGMSAADLAKVERFVADNLVAVLERHRAVVVDGGTDSGLMSVLGRARHAADAGFTLLGVAAAQTVGPGRDGVGLERHHSAVVLVPGATWGDESPWLAAVADLVAGALPSATLVVNGGTVTYRDVEESLGAGRRVLVVAGSGRAADAIASAASGGATDARTARIAASPLVTTYSIDSPDQLAAAVDAALTPPRPG